MIRLAEPLLQAQPSRVSTDSPRMRAHQTATLLPFRRITLPSSHPVPPRV